MPKAFNRLLFGILSVGSVWWMFDQDGLSLSEKPPLPEHMEAAKPDLLQESSASVQPRPLHAKSDQTFNSPDSIKPLTPAETHRLGSWMREKGYLFHIVEGGASGIPSASGYDAMEDDALRQVAAGGDRTAALTLGQRLFDRYREAGRPMSKPDRDEAMQLLTQASIMGYTASLERLVEIVHQEALMSRGRRRDDPGVSIELLSKAYAYTYLLQKRGDLTDGLYLQLIKQTDPLTPEQDAIARREADLIYEEWNGRRLAMGVPPFEDGVPDDIMDLRRRVVAMYLNR